MSDVLRKGPPGGPGGFPPQRVEEAMTEQPYTVEPETPLDQVARTMAEKKFGSAVVLQNHKVVGIFTTVDACQALSELLQTRLAK